MNIYFNRIGDEFVSLDVYIAYLGFLRKKEHNLLFFEDINEVPANKKSMIIGFIDDTVKFFEKLEIEIPKPLNIPDSLNSDFYLYRKIEIKTLEEFYKDWNGECKIFIKPYDKVKLFAGGVISNASSKEFFKEYPSDTKVMVSEYIDMSSEYRCFVNRGKLVGIKHYNSDFTLFPDMNFISDAILNYSKAPISYSLDFAVSNNGKTILIEANDGWSLGCYGLDAETYSRFLMDRWIEITKCLNKYTKVL